MGNEGREKEDGPRSLAPLYPPHSEDTESSYACNSFPAEDLFSASSYRMLRLGTAPAGTHSTYPRATEHGPAVRVPGILQLSRDIELGFHRTY